MCLRGRPRGLHKCWPANVQSSQLNYYLHHGTSIKLQGLSTYNYACEETSSLAHVVEQWTGNPKAAGWIPSVRQLFRIACF